MGFQFQLVLTLMTLNDRERRNTLILRFSANWIALQAHYATVVEERPMMSVICCLPVPVFHF